MSILTMLSILQQIEQSPLHSIPELLWHILTSNIPDYQASIHAIKSPNAPCLILETLLLHGCQSTATEWAVNISQETFKHEIIRASNVENGLHFNASREKSVDLIGFDFH